MSGTLAGFAGGDYLLSNEFPTLRPVSDDPLKGRALMTSILMILLYAIKIFYYIVIAHVVMSWLITFNVLNLHQPLVYQIWSGLNRLLEPIYGRIRNFLPNMGGLDLAPLVVFFGLYALQTIIINNLYSF